MKDKKGICKICKNEISIWDMSDWECYNCLESKKALEFQKETIINEGK